MNRNTNLFEALCDGPNLHRAWLDVWSGRTTASRHVGAGVDGVTVTDWAAGWDRRLAALQVDLLTGDYRPSSLKWFELARSTAALGRAPRRLGIPTVTDRVAQRAAKNVLEPLWETRFLSCSHGFRPERSVFTAVAHVLLHEAQGRRWVVDGDITACFDSLDHDRLLREVAREGDDRLTELVAAWLAAGSRGGAGDGRGVVQGAPLSPLLANIYLHAFDVGLIAAGYALVRYADDFAILCCDRREALDAAAAAGAQLARIGLALNRTKTRVLPFGPSFVFLGARFGEGGDDDPTDR